MLEYDVQLYFRRARAWPAVFGEPAQMYARCVRPAARPAWRGA